MLTISLAKLSVAQDTDPSESKFFWQHEAQQILLILDDYGTQPSSQLLKLVQGGQVRQNIELERQINQGHQLIQEMQARGVPLKVEQLPISAIIRCPLLAIRWQLPNNKIRRVQLKFRSSEDFDVVYNRLYQLGLYMSTSPESLVQMRPPVPPPKASSNRSLEPNFPKAPYSQPLTSEGLTCTPSRLTEISDRPFTALNAPTSLESRMQEAAHARSTSAYTSGVHEEGSSAGHLAGPLARPVFDPRPTSATSDIVGNNTVFPPRKSTSTGEEISKETSERPESAMLYNRPNTAESLLPPRRELPFQRASSTLSAGGDSNRPSSRPSTGLMGPPPLPARLASLRPRTSQGASQVTNLPLLPQPTLIGQFASQVPLMQQPPRTLDQNPFRPAHTSPYEEGKKHCFLNQSSASSPSPLNRASFTTASTLQPPDPFSNTIQTLHPNLSQNAPPTSAKPGSTYENLKSFRNAPKFDSSSAESLKAYAMQSDEGRRAALNEYIFQNLENDDFLTLVEDMETCWARIALGMK